MKYNGFNFLKSFLRQKSIRFEFSKTVLYRNRSSRRQFMTSYNMRLLMGDTEPWIVLLFQGYKQAPTLPVSRGFVLRVLH